MTMIGSSLVVLVAVVCTCTCTTAVPGANKPNPNILFWLADDLNYDLVEKHQQAMPNLQKHFGPSAGVEFVNHVAAAPVCGPSRSSLLAGRYPHNVGYVANTAAASIAAFSKVQNHTIGAWLTKAGYYTAFLGKYVNGMECDVPSGWRHWGGLTCSHVKAGVTPQFPQGTALGGTYNYYNSSQWGADWDRDGNLLARPTISIRTGEHQSDFLAQQTLDQAQKAQSEGSPFFIHITALMVHYGTCYGPQAENLFAFDDPWFERMIEIPGENKSTGIPISPCPSTANKHYSDSMMAPHYPNWNKSETGGVPDYIAMRVGLNTTHEYVTPFEAGRQHMGFRNRSSALMDLDKMFGVVLGGLEKMGVYDNTVVIFSSDNGYHLGEHKMLFGKSEPYETDIRLPMFWRGPGVGTGIRKHPTNHMDITATIATIAGALNHVPVVLDGESLVSILNESPVPLSAWRNFSYSEFYVAENTWQAIRLIDPTSGEVTTTYHYWCSGQSELFDMTKDPFQLNNMAIFDKSATEKLLRFVAPLSNCSGRDCYEPKRWNGNPSENPLPCHVTGPILDVDEAWIDPSLGPAAWNV